MRLPFQYFIVFLLLLVGGPVESTPIHSPDADIKAGHDVLDAWVVEYLDLTKNCVGFSAPVAARAINYINIGLYESAVEFMPASRSLSGQLEGYARTTWKKEDDQLFLPHVMNETVFTLIRFFYKNMPPSYAKRVASTYQRLLDGYLDEISPIVQEHSTHYAQQLANEIIAWSSVDGGHEGYNRNFPGTHASGQCVGCWSKTNPNYESALLPFWGENRLLVRSNADVCADIPSPAFSEHSDSEFYAENLALSQLLLDLSKEHEVIAEYWDDAPGVSGTPIGHFISLTRGVTRNESADLKTTLEVYALIGIAINDALIECWRLKYLHNLIRPITYIQRNIREDFNPAITTPPFPEYPSGHSFQAGAGTAVLIHYFTDSLSFVDSTNARRTDIDGTPRSFSSFSALAKEMSISRYYGGIHYDSTLEISLEYGNKLAQNTITSIQLD